MSDFCDSFNPYFKYLPPNVGVWFAPKIFVETCKPTLFTFTFCYHVVQNIGVLWVPWFDFFKKPFMCFRNDIILYYLKLVKSNTKLWPYHARSMQHGVRYRHDRASGLCVMSGFQILHYLPSVSILGDLYLTFSQPIDPTFLAAWNWNETIVIEYCPA